MLRRTALAALFAGAALALSGQARAGGAWISSSSLTPVEQRVAIAVGPSRTTVWTSLRFNAAGGTLGIVVPAPPGASLDISSDAWFEALEVATAPRIFPPSGAMFYCPGKSGPPEAFETAGQTAHLPSLTRPAPPLTVLADAGAVGTWATQNNLVVPPALQEALGSLTGVQFVVVAYPAPTGAGVTPTLRISMTGTPAMLPLGLASAGSANLPVSAWTIGPGEGDLIDAAQVAISPSSLAWNAGAQASNYDTVRSAALASGPDTFLVELAGHAALVQNLSIAGGTAFVDGVVTTFFERAAAYGDGNFDSATCIGAATPLLDSSDPVADVCPHAAYGNVPPAAPCTESPVPPQIDPGSLRCGAAADDLALALSGLSPAAAWVTRQSLIIGAGTSGVDTPVGFSPGTAEGPVLSTSSVDYADCADGGMSSSSSSSSGTSTGTGTGTGTKTGGSSGTASGGSEVIGGADGVGILGDVIETAGEAAVDGCDCSGSQGSSDSSGEACGSDSSGSGSCSGDSSGSGGSGSCSSDSSSDSGCNSGSSESGCSGGSGDSGCSGGSGDSGCSGSSFNCTTAGSRKARGPRMSMVMMLALTVLAPLRRRTRPRRRG